MVQYVHVNSYLRGDRRGVNRRFIIIDIEATGMLQNEMFVNCLELQRGQVSIK